MHKGLGSDSNPSVVTRDVLEDTAIGVGELATKKRSVGLNKSTQRAIHQKTCCKETFVNGQTQRRKGHSQPKGKGKWQGKGKTNPGKGKNNQAGSPDEEVGQRRLDDFGIKRQRVAFGGDVQEHNDEFEMPRVDRAAYLFCVHKCNSVMSDGLEMPSSSGRVVSGVQGSEEPVGTHETKPDQSTGELLFAVGCRDDRPIVDSGSVVSTCPVDCATSVSTEKVNYSINLGVCWVNHCNITVSNVMFLSPKERAAP